MAKLELINVAGNTSRSALEIISAPGNFNVGYDKENDVYGVQFTTTDDGRGTGSQFVPLNRLEDFCDVLASKAEPGALTTRDLDNDPVEVMRDTIALIPKEGGHGPNDPMFVSFRTARGQGMKPTRLPVSEIRVIADYIRSRIPASELIVKNALAAAAKKKA